MLEHEPALFVPATADKSAEDTSYCAPDTGSDHPRFLVLWFLRHVLSFEKVVSAPGARPKADDFDCCYLCTAGFIGL